MINLSRSKRRKVFKDGKGDQEYSVINGLTQWDGLWTRLQRLVSLALVVAPNETMERGGGPMEYTSLYLRGNNISFLYPNFIRRDNIRDYFKRVRKKFTRLPVYQN